MPVQKQHYYLGGGLDLHRSALRKKPGSCLQAQNVEQKIEGGYRRLSGYSKYNSAEVTGGGPLRGVWRYDGKTYALRDNTAVAPTSCVLYVGNTPETAWSAVDLGRSIAFTSGGEYHLAFTSGGTATPLVGQIIEGLTSFASAVIVSITVTSGSWAGGDAAGYFKLKQQIGDFTAENCEVDGSGADDLTIAGDSTQQAFAVGDTIVGETSTASADVTDVQITGGSWDDGDAAGVLHLTSQTGTFQAESLKVGSITGWATIAGDSTAITLSPSGAYEFQNHDFGTGIKMYGVDGVNRAFEFDGTTFVQIYTGNTTDTPDHLACHKDHLFLAYGNSLQHSSIGEPKDWVSGAAEFRLRSDVSHLITMPGGILGAFCRNSISLLYGDSVANWERKQHASTTGCVPGTMQQLGSRTVYLDDRGIVDFSATDVFGDFADAAISRPVQPILDEQFENVVSSGVVRNKAQYRLFFEDGSGLIVTFNKGEVSGIMRLLFPEVVRCIYASESETGQELILFGGDAGYVYQMESGDSFDGANIEAYFTTAYYSFGDNTRVKRFRRVQLDMTSDGPVNLRIHPDAEFEMVNMPNKDPYDVFQQGTAHYLGHTALGVIVLGGVLILDARGELGLHGVWLSLMVSSDSNDEVPWEVDGATVTYSLRRMVRG